VVSLRVTAASLAYFVEIIVVHRANLGEDAGSFPPPFASKLCKLDRGQPPVDRGSDKFVVWLSYI